MKNCCNHSKKDKQCIRKSDKKTFFPKSSIDSKSPQPGEIVNIKINEIRPFSLTGSLL